MAARKTKRGKAKAPRSPSKSKAQQKREHEAKLAARRARDRVRRGQKLVEEFGASVGKAVRLLERRVRDRARRAEEKALREFEAARLAEHEAAQAAQRVIEAAEKAKKLAARRARDQARRDEEKAIRDFEKARLEEHEKEEKHKKSERQKVREIIELAGGTWKNLKQNRGEGLIERRNQQGSVKTELIDLEISVHNLTAHQGRVWVQVGLFFSNVAPLDSWGRSASERYDRFKGNDKGPGSLGAFIAWTAIYEVKFLGMAFNEADQIGTRAAVSENRDHKVTGCAFRAFFGTESPKHWIPMRKVTLQAVQARRRQSSGW
jgi:hypothetical protein